MLQKEEGGRFAVLDKEWEGETELILKLPMQSEIISRPNGLYALARGPLIYSLKIKEKWVQINTEVQGREYPHCDYEIYAKTPWNYGLRIDKDNIAGSLHFEEGTVGSMPFSPEGAPVKATLKGSKIDWKLINGSAAVQPGLSWISEEVEELTFIPYGCTNLRLTEMPIL